MFKMNGIGRHGAGNCRKMKELEVNMSEKQGFQNCPSIKEFAVGMRVQDTDHHRHPSKWATVRWVEGTGFAHCETDDKSAMFVGVYRIPLCILDLDSLWEGREYMGEPLIGNNRAIVRLVGDNWIGYSERNCNLMCSRNGFIRYYKPLPLSPPEKPWKPIKGDKVLFGKDVVEVLAVWGDMAWIPCGGTAETVGIDELRPLPATTPVKVGEALYVKARSGYQRYGMVNAVRPETCTFTLFPCSGSDPIFNWNKVEIVHLVPADSKAAGE